MNVEFVVESLVGERKDPPTGLDFSLVARQVNQHAFRLQLTPAVGNDSFLVGIAESKNLDAIVIDAAESNRNQRFPGAPGIRLQKDIDAEVSLVDDLVDC